MDTGVELESAEKGSECSWGPRKIAEGVDSVESASLFITHLKNHKFPKFSTNFSLFSALSDNKVQLARTLDSFGVQSVRGMLNF